MSLTRADLIADICIFGGAVALAASFVVRPTQEGPQRAVRRQIRRTLLGGAVLVLSMADSTQVRIDQLSGVPNLGMLVRLVLLPVISYRVLALQDAMISADRRKRAWHAGFTAVAVVVTVVCWQAGVPHSRSLSTIPVAVPLGEADHWLYALAWMYAVELIVLYGDATRTAFNILMHVYATGYDRATCRGTLLFGLAEGCFCAVGVGLLLYPPGQATGQLRWIDFSTLTTEVLGSTGALLSLLAYATPLWGSQRVNQQPDRLERFLHVLLLLSTYGSVRRLALRLQDVLPDQRMAPGGRETALWRVRRVADLSLLLQLFKTVINDARLLLVPYVSPDFSGEADPKRAAGALTEALTNYSRGHRPVQQPKMENPLRAGHLFNDERYLAAIWHANQGLKQDA